MNKGKEIFNLLKVPDDVLLKLSREEVGKLNSYIDELNYKLKMKDEEIEKLRSTSNNSSDDMESEILKLRKRVENQRTILSAQNKKMRELKEKDLSNSYLVQIGKMHKEIELLQKQIIELKKKSE